MQTILFVVSAPPYGSERMLSALRLATALLAQDGEAIQLRLFLLSDAVTVALPGQQSAVAGASLGAMLETLLAAGVDVRLCRTCLQARGLTDLDLLPGAVVGTMQELAEWTLTADKVLSF